MLLLTGERSAKSPFGSTRELVIREVESLYPTISMPVAVAIFNIEASAANSMLPCEPVVEVHGHGVVPSSSQEVRS